MFVEVWERLKDTLKFAQTELLSEGIALTLPEAIPRATQEYEGFVAVIARNPVTYSMVVAPLGDYHERAATLVFPLDVYSPPILLDYDVRMVSNMFTVIDAMITVFSQRPRLEDNLGRGLKGINPNEPVMLRNGTYNVEPMLANSKDFRHHFSTTITVPYLWTCPERQT